MKLGLKYTIETENLEDFVLRKARMVCKEIEAKYPDMDKKEIGRVSKKIVLGMLETIANNN